MEISYECEKNKDLKSKKAENEASINKAKVSLPWLTFLAPISEIFSVIAIMVAISFTISNPMAWPVILISLLSLSFPCWTNISLFKNIEKIKKLLKENKDIDKQMEFEETTKNGVEVGENVNEKVVKKNVVIKPTKLESEEKISNQENNSNNFTL